MMSDAGTHEDKGSSSSSGRVRVPTTSGRATTTADDDSDAAATAAALASSPPTRGRNGAVQQQEREEEGGRGGGAAVVTSSSSSWTSNVQQRHQQHQQQPVPPPSYRPVSAAGARPLRPVAAASAAGVNGTSSTTGNNNEDAFSSSSEEEEDEDESGGAAAGAGAAPTSTPRRGSTAAATTTTAPYGGAATAASASTVTPSTSTNPAPAVAAAAGVSEWDKALLLGKDRPHVTASVLPAFVEQRSSSSSAAGVPTTSKKNEGGASAAAAGAAGDASDPQEHRLYYHDGPSPSIEIVPSTDNGENDDATDTDAIGGTTNATGAAAAYGRASPSTSSFASRQRQYDSAAVTDPQQHLASGVLPDVLMEMRQRIESLQLFDSDILRLADPALGGGAARQLGRGRRHHRQQHNVQGLDGRRRLLPPSTTPGNNEDDGFDDDDGMDEDDDMELEDDEEYRASLKRSSQQSISAAVLVSLAHKRYERRRLAAMELEKICRALLYQGETERIRAILLLLSDDYVRSTSEDARKGGVVALAACAIALKRGNHSTSTSASASGDPIIDECRDLILASVVHACQDHSSRVRYYATESLFNVVKVMPALAVQHFFILFEILRSLYADVDADVRSGAELLDRKLKEVTVAAMNAGTFAAEICLPVFCRFVYLRHKATKHLTLSWLQELHDKLLDGNPILEFLHLFLGGVFDMVADPTTAIREAAIHFLQSVLPKLLKPEDGDVDAPGESAAKVDFDKILQSLVTTMEHPDPFVRKVSMYWVSRIVKSHCGAPPDNPPSAAAAAVPLSPDDEQDSYNRAAETKEGQRPHSALGMPPPPPPPPPPPLSPASISVRHSLPHILPGILLSIGDDYEPRPKPPTKGSSSVGAAGSGKDAFLPEFTTRELAQQTNDTLQAAVRREGPSFVPYLDGFIVALREELDSPGADDPRSETQGATAVAVAAAATTTVAAEAKKKDDALKAAGLTAMRYPPPVERSPYRMDVKQDGTGIESPGWFSSSGESPGEGIRPDSEATVLSRLCALDWVVVLYESVVPILLKADYAREFVYAIIHQLMDNAPRSIVYKSLEVLAKITVPATGEAGQRSITSPAVTGPIKDASVDDGSTSSDAKLRMSPMNESNISYAFDILDPARRAMMSRNREVFAALIELYSLNMSLMGDLSSVIAYMCRLQPPEFVFVSFSVELDRFLSRKLDAARKTPGGTALPPVASAADLRFVSSFIQNLTHVLLNQPEAKPMRDVLRDCARSPRAGAAVDERARQRSRLFHIMLHSFAHNVAATISLCIWAGAYRTTYQFLSSIDPLDINLMFLLEVDRFIEHLERPLFRHLHVRMLEIDDDPDHEGSGSMLFKALKSLLMMLPQSTCYHILRDRLVSVSRFRQGSSGRRSNVLLSNNAAANASGTTTTATTRIGGPNFLSSQSGSDAGTATVGIYLTRVLEARALHCETAWRTIRSESLAIPADEQELDDAAAESTGRLDWLGYASEAEEAAANAARRLQHRPIEDVQGQKSNYSDLSRLRPGGDVSGTLDAAASTNDGKVGPDACRDDENCDWKTYWEASSK